MYVVTFWLSIPIPFIRMSPQCQVYIYFLSMQSLAERMAENAHNSWALQLKKNDGKAYNFFGSLLFFFIIFGPLHL